MWTEWPLGISLHYGQPCFTRSHAALAYAPLNCVQTKGRARERPAVTHLIFQKAIIGRAQEDCCVLASHMSSKRLRAGMKKHLYLGFVELQQCILCQRFNIMINIHEFSFRNYNKWRHCESCCQIDSFQPSPKVLKLSDKLHISASDTHR